MFYFVHYKISYLSYITSQTFLICSYQTLFLLLDHTLIYHEINYIDFHLDSMEREVEGGTPSFIQYHANKNYKMQNEYLPNYDELFEDRKFFFITFMANKLENDYYKIWLSVIYYMINQYRQMMQWSSYKVLQSHKFGFMN